MAVRFLVYGLLGWCLEILFTGVSNALWQRDRSATGKTYLWMLPIYGLGGLALEALHHGLAAAHAGWFVRGLAYLAAIYAFEFTSGWLLRHLVGRCPWDYTGRGVNVRGLIRLDYAPAWFACGLFFEQVQTMLDAASRVQAFATG